MTKKEDETIEERILDSVGTIEWHSEYTLKSIKNTLYFIASILTLITIKLFGLF